MLIEIKLTILKVTEDNCCPFTLKNIQFLPISKYFLHWSHACFVVEGDTGGPSTDGYQDALSKKQRRPQEDERRRKEQGAAVS